MMFVCGRILRTIIIMHTKVYKFVLSLQTFGVNKFADLTEKEKKPYFGCFEPRKPVDSLTRPECTNITSKDIRVKDDVPETFDWRDYDVVTNVRDQGICGSCYAFSAIGNVESLYAMKCKELVELSVQQIVDCDAHNRGCRGGLMDNVLLYIKRKGIVLERDYPTINKNGRCRFDESKIKLKLSGCNLYNLGKDEEMLKKLLHLEGPLSIGIDANDLEKYTKDIIPNCGYKKGNHAVLLVGYGIENATKYWTLKNSWGEDWGEKGYFRIKRGSNQCGLMNDMITSGVM